MRRGVHRLKAVHGAVAVVLVLGGTSCSSDGGGRSKSEPPASTVTPTAPDHVASPLIGAWESSRPGENTTLAYRFTEDDRYLYAAVLTQPRPGGVYELTHKASGEFQHDGERITLYPSKATTTRKDPEHPDEDYRDRPEPLTPRTYVWNVNGETLTLTDAEGLQLEFQRISPGA